ncbi:MAG TPA: hypothetical protein QGI59_01275 [Candidatus Poseidoniia archaeon]|jgi:hypothetical protein|nr:hypothetical protein [Candidatus Poseidoniia archaeon]|tara:strand:+ start:8298 stop:8606 length:309 start_codon:yes stop_codon:yes gene_type:complete
MSLLSVNDNDKDFHFDGFKHRLFIEGRGFDFRFFKILTNGSAKLELVGPEDPLYTLLDFEEPRVIYVVSRIGNKELILQGCVIKEINGDKCLLSYSKLQLES